MARITEVKNVKIGEWVHTNDSRDICEVYKITRANRVEDIDTGKLRYTNVRLYFTTEPGSNDYVEHRADQLITAY